jgi:hypothetical protein
MKMMTVLITMAMEIMMIMVMMVMMMTDTLLQLEPTR